MNTATKAAPTTSL